MVHAKRQCPPPQRPTSKTPRLASWKNQARSCFALDPTRAATGPTYIPWNHDPNHKVLLNLPNITVAAGALPPYSSTLFHSHHHNAFVLSVLDTPDFTLQNLQPPDYQPRPHAERSGSLTRGTCFSQCPFSSKLPLVHRAITTHHPVAFLMIESSAQPLPQSAPIFVVAKHPAISTENRTPTNFWAATELQLQPGAEAKFDSRSSSSPLPLARIICRVQCPLDNLEIQTPNHMQRKTVQTTLGGTLVQAIAISGFKDSSDTCLRIQNTGSKDWSGVIVDIFGTAFL